jgi:cell wall-associated NlpC family hydrolase
MKIAQILIALLLFVSAAAALAAESVDPLHARANADKSPGYLERARELAINALSLIGVSYRSGGTDPDDGFDCSGFVNHVFQQVTGRVLPRDSQGMARAGDKIERAELEPGDLVFYNTRRHPFSHVGIYIGESRFVHSPRHGRSVQIVDMRDQYWQKRYNGARRVNF